MHRLPFAATAAVVVTVGGSALALAITNPSLKDYEDHAGQELVSVLTQELCRSDGVPMLLQLWIRDCPQLVASQQDSLGALAGRFTTHTNLGVASLFSTRLGGQELMSGLRLPRIEVTSLGIAGRFVMISSERDPGQFE